MATTWCLWFLWSQQASFFSLIRHLVPSLRKAEVVRFSSTATNEAKLHSRLSTWLMFWTWGHFSAQVPAGGAKQKLANKAKSSFNTKCEFCPVLTFSIWNHKRRNMNCYCYFAVSWLIVLLFTFYWKVKPGRSHCDNLLHTVWQHFLVNVCAPLGNNGGNVQFFL